MSTANTDSSDEVNILQLTLHGRLLGYLAGFSNGRNVLRFAEEFTGDLAGIPWRAIKPHLDDVMDKARSLWPDALKDFPMDEAHKVGLRNHWSRLNTDFEVNVG